MFCEKSDLHPRPAKSKNNRQQSLGCCQELMHNTLCSKLRAGLPAFHAYSAGQTPDCFIFRPRLFLQVLHTLGLWSSVIGGLADISLNKTFTTAELIRCLCVACGGCPCLGWHSQVVSKSLYAPASSLAALSKVIH